MEFLFNQKPFVAFGQAHFLPLLFIAFLGLILIVIARKFLNNQQQKALILVISFFPFLGYILNVALPIVEGDFNIQDDLPFHVCRFLALACPWVIWKNKMSWMAVFYFWILAGTLNANITPDVEFGFPHWSYFTYWMVHSFLIIIPLYYIFVFKLSITLRDLKNAFWLANLFLILTLIINYLIGSNYMYTIAKPPSPTILDSLGPWPIYLISGQALALILFMILYLPFIRKRKIETTS